MVCNTSSVEAPCQDKIGIEIKLEIMIKTIMTKDVNNGGKPREASALRSIIKYLSSLVATNPVRVRGKINLHISTRCVARYVSSDLLLVVQNFDEIQQSRPLVAFGHAWQIPISCSLSAIKL